MDITYLGHSSFKLVTKDVTVVTDPFDPKDVGLKFPKISADIVLISHDHFDHNKVEMLSDVKRVINGPGEYEMQGVSVIGISSFHDDKKGELRGKNTIYVIEIENVRLAHLGDLGHTLSEKDLGKLGNIDVLMIPVGGEFTIDAKTATIVAQSIEPKIVIPMHYKVEGLDPKIGDELAGVDNFINELSVKVEKTSKISVKDGAALSDETKIVLLDIK